MWIKEQIKQIKPFMRSNDWLSQAHSLIDKFDTVANFAEKYPIEIHSSARIHNTAIIISGSYIGENAIVGPYCYVKGNSYIGNGVKLGFCVEISAAVILDNTKISHHACITNSIIGRFCNLGYGSVTSSRNLIGKKIKVYTSETEFILSDMRHHGAVIEDNVEFGVNVMVMPGSSICSDSKIFPNSIVSGYIKPNTCGYVKTAQQR